MGRHVTRFVLTALLVASVASVGIAAPSGPQKVRPERFYPVLMPDGSVWGTSVQALAEGRLAMCAVVSTDNGRTWGARRTLVELPKVTPPKVSWADAVPFVDRDAVLHFFLLKWDQTKSRAPIPAELSLWHVKAALPYQQWTEPKRWFDGYIGALLSAVQMPSGTIVVPFAFMTDRSYSKAAQGLMSWVYMGEHTSTAVYSTDGGNTFCNSPTPINMPATILLGNENGAVEPVCITLKDGRAWMLMRTQAGRQWEAFSKDGISWSPPRPSRLISSDSPASLTRLKDGRIVAIWNCCQRYPYAHGGRQVLHAAISSDEGTTWHGFREVLRDPRRLQPALPIRGDYGTAYPVGSATVDGKMVFSTGQGQTTGAFLLDPAWLTETQQSDDFSHGLDAWSVYGTKGVALIPHPDKPDAKVLSIQRTDREFPAGAVWNFPNGRAGTVRVRFQLQSGAAPTSITLSDHFSSPFDTAAEMNGLYSFKLAESMSAPNGQRLSAGTWHDLELQWDVRKRACAARIDGSLWRECSQLRLITEGVNYLRFRALSDTPAPSIQIESVSARVELIGSGIAPSDVPD
jgi:hypothetical protein